MKDNKDTLLSAEQLTQRIADTDKVLVAGEAVKAIQRKECDNYINGIIELRKDLPNISALFFGPLLTQLIDNYIKHNCHEN